MLAFALASSLLSSPAQAATGDLVLYRKGPFPAHVWVDGVPQGKVKNKKKATILQVEPGLHEVWFSGEASGTVTLCHGVVDVPAGQYAAVEMQVGMTSFVCNGATPGYPNGPSAFKGSFMQFQVDSALDVWVSIDGGQPFAFPPVPFELNLVPGTHTVVLYRDVHQASVFDQGTVTLQPGQRLPVTCTTAGCLGFDQPPIVIMEVQQAPQMQLATPGISIEVNINQ